MNNVSYNVWAASSPIELVIPSVTAFYGNGQVTGKFSVIFAKF